LIPRFTRYLTFYYSLKKQALRHHYFISKRNERITLGFIQMGLDIVVSAIWKIRLIINKITLQQQGSRKLHIERVGNYKTTLK